MKLFWILGCLWVGGLNAKWAITGTDPLFGDALFARGLDVLLVIYCAVAAYRAVQARASWTNPFERPE